MQVAEVMADPACFLCLVIRWGTFAATRAGVSAFQSLILEAERPSKPNVLAASLLKVAVTHKVFRIMVQPGSAKAHEVCLLYAAAGTW